jgi:hypothetical protein
MTRVFALAVLSFESRSVSWLETVAVLVMVPVLLGAATVMAMRGATPQDRLGLVQVTRPPS